MSKKFRVVTGLSLEGIHPADVATQGVAEYYFRWKDFASGCGASRSAALFISEPACAKIERVISEFVRAAHDDHPATQEAHKASAWLHVRVTKPNDKFDVPRWHQDGPYMELDPGREEDMRYKYCLTLMGPGTMFLEQTPELAAYTATAAFREERSQVAKQLSTYRKYCSIAGEVVRCTWKRSAGDTSADVHSEPPHSEDRIFLAVVFMSNDELDKLTENRK